MDILDFWTQRSLDAYWKELVKETQEVNLTGWTETRDEYDSDTGPSD
jgi:predicted 3-demethylubiquinone-9 3-methyltransferase (glyoxalase superfamily)